MKKQLRAVLSKLESQFYDSYTGWKKTRVAVAALVCVVFAVCIGVALHFIPSNSQDGAQPGVTASADGSQDGTGGFAVGGDGVARPTDTETDSFIPSSRYNSPTPTETPEDEIPDRWSRPAFGDVDASGGVSDDADSGDADSGVSPETVYDDTDTERFRSTVLKTVEKINGNYLLSMNTALAGGDWRSFVSDAVLILSDVSFIGERVKRTLGADSVAAWSALEPVLTQLREEMYLCETSEDAREIAIGETLRNAAALSDTFYSAVLAETSRAAD
jgi:hypothetical protein